MAWRRDGLSICQRLVDRRQAVTASTQPYSIYGSVDLQTDKTLLLVGANGWYSL